MNKWNELRTAYCLARLGNVSAAARSLGVHRATVVRHIDALEAEMGGKLFLRHARGVTPTDAGLDLMRVGAATDEQFRQLAGRTAGQGGELRGELIVTSVEIVADPLMHAIRQFRAAHPKTTVHYRVSRRVLELAYGEAHVAVRSGPKPSHPDNVVRRWMTVRTGLYGHRDYIAARGLPSSAAELGTHDFIAGDEGTIALPFLEWLKDNVAPERVVFRSENQRIKFKALESGLGLGFCPEHHVANHPELVEVVAPRDEWDVPFWLVTHVDLHRSRRVQALLRAISQTR
ncbi:MAG: LysR family transcriptional regulator [Sandaracinaceae bacterium]